MKRAHHRVVIVGSGLTGSGVALALAARGIPVALLDQDGVAYNRASLRNEGKIHLGLIYANDATLATAELQLNGALRFRALLKGWIGTHADALSRSSPFMYLVARDSLLSPEQLSSHYLALDKCYHDLIRADPELDYLGERPEGLFHPYPSSLLASRFNTDRIAAAFHTVERAIDTEELGRFLRQTIDASANVAFLPHRKVLAMERANGKFRLAGAGADGKWEIEADQVVNATWENRFALDHMVGIESLPGWVHRLKYRVIARLPEHLHGAPSATMVLGPYGDVVVRGDGTAYLSWYPAGLQGWTHELAPPASWDAPCRGDADVKASKTIASEILAGIDGWYPGMGHSYPLLVDAGAIVAYGSTDVDNASSALHNRTRVGVTSVDGFHSIDPGKLTTAPLFAQEAADRVYELQRE